MIKTNYFEFVVRARLESETRFGSAKLTQSFSGLKKIYITIFDTQEELLNIIESRGLTSTKKKSAISEKYLQRQTLVLSEPVKEGEDVDLTTHHIFVRTSGAELPSASFLETLVEGFGLSTRFSEAGESIQRTIKAKYVSEHWKCAREMLLEADNRYLELEKES